MKTILSATLVLAAVTFCSAATNDPTAILQQGLFEEEANHNLAAAMQAYQAVVNQFDQNRKLAATAVFRLGECYRRQGDTNQASAQYERVLREFADQTQLATLSRQNLIALGINSPPTATGTLSEVAARQEQKRLLEEEVKLVEKKLSAKQKQIEVGAIGQEALWPIQHELLDLKRQIAALDAGAPITILTSANTVGAPTSTEAEEVNRIQAMIKDSPDLINAKDTTGKTPLHLAAGKGQLVVADFLLRNGADVESRDHFEATPLYDAAASGHKAMVELLINHKANLERSDRNGWTPLYRAADKGFLTVVQVLLAHGADPNARSKSGSAPLHAAISEAQRTIIETLLAQKADVNAVDNEGTTPLHIAAARGLDAICTLLMDHGANLNAQDKLRRTPLAASIEQMQVSVAKLLLAKKADPNVQFEQQIPNAAPGNNWVRTPLYEAVDRGNVEMIELLLRNGADPNILVNAYTPLLFAVLHQKQNLVPILLGHGADPNTPDKEGRFALHYALKQPSTMGLLISAKAAVNSKTKEGETPLYWAVGAELKPAAELLLSHKADPNMQDKDGLAPLHLAVLRGNKDLVDLLLTNGADPNIRNNDGKTPLDWARNHPGYTLSGTDGGIQLPRPLRGFPTGVPTGGVGQPLPARPLQFVAPAGSTPNPGGIAALLKNHGAVEEMPDFSSIRVTRQGLPQSAPVFERDADGSNQFTLMEFISNFYGHGNPLPFPDFSRVFIHRPVRAHPGKQTDLTVNLLNASNGLDCGKDMPLYFGDIVELPEREHSLAEPPMAFSGSQVSDLATCIRRKVTFIVKGKATEVTLHGQTGDTYLSQAMTSPAVQAILLSSSDLSRVQIKRSDQEGQKRKERIMDVKTFWNQTQPLKNDFWLRDGDVVEIPEKP